MKNNILKRVFSSGAVRNNNNKKLDYSGFLDPAVENSFAQYMHKHRKMEDGTYRNSSDWKKGIPNQVLMESLYRHMMDVHLLHEGYDVIYENGDKITIKDCLNGVKFNINAYLLNIIKESDTKVVKRGE